jgi:hypothetical protein
MAVLGDAVARWAGEKRGRAAGQAVNTQASDAACGIVWIGPAVRPEPHALPQAIGPTATPLALAKQSMVVTPHGRTSRFWAIERAVRCTAIGCVIADGTGANHVVTRRLHVIAARTNTLVLLARPVTEQHEPSSAQSRWLVRRMPTTTPHPCWHVDLLRERFTASTTAGERWTTSNATALPLNAGRQTWTPHRTLACSTPASNHA